jgi:photosystem II stability/assembly factor-like uncharacterized protein
MPIDLEQLRVSFEEEGEDDEEDLKGTWALRLAGINFPHASSVGYDPRLANVRGPAQAMLNAGVPRAPVAGRHNWIPRGPRNVGGRVRALVVHPHDDNILFAGSATGGVFKSVNGGDTWFPLWHEQESLTIASIALHHRGGDPIASTTVWVATGEPVQNGFTIAGAGVFRSTDNGENFAQVATVAQLDGMELIEAIACHPTDRDHAWVVGRRGVFRIRVPAVGPVVIDQFDAGVEYSDVAFGGALPAAPLPVGPQPHPFVLYLCRKFTTLGDIVRIDDPTAAPAAIAPLFVAAAASIAQPIPAAGGAVDPTLLANFGPPGQMIQPGANMIRAKLAVCRDTPAVVFVLYAQQTQLIGGSDGFAGVFRCQQANTRPAFNAAAWQEIPLGTGFDLVTMGQGAYNLAIGVSPTNPELVFVGMVELFMIQNANHPIPGAPAPTWVKAMVGQRFGFEFNNHPDFHAIAFEQVRNPPRVFAGNDGGVYLNRDYHNPATTFFPFMIQPDPLLGLPNLTIVLPTFPLNPEPTHLWERRHLGLHASQPFDVTSSPVSPTLYGSGFIDNGLWFSSGGDTWRYIATGDGGHVAFDAHDPYKLIATWQNVMEAVEFGGGNMDQLPALAAPIGTFTSNRPLSNDFLDVDPARLIADTVMHPTRPHTILNTRQHRVYRSTNADSFTPLPAGTATEIICTHFNVSGAPEIVIFGVEFQRTEGGVKLGFVDAQIDLATLPAGASGNVHCVTGNPGPWSLAEGDTLTFTLIEFVVGGPVVATRQQVTVTFRAGAGFRDLTRVTPAELATAIQTAVNAVVAPFTVRVRPVFLNAPLSIELRTRRVAPASIRLDGTAAPVLGVTAGLYSAEPNRHASLTLQSMNINQVIANPRIEVARVNLTGLTLRVGVNGGALVPVNLAAASIGDPAQPSGALLANAIASAAGADLEVVPVMARKRAVLLSDTGSFRFRGTALDRLGYPPGFVATFAAAPLQPGTWTAADLSPVGGVDRRLSLRPPGAAADTNVDFTAADVVDQARVTPEEISRHVNAVLTAAGIAPADLRCVVAATAATGDPSEIAFAPSAPDHLWIGGSDGRVLRSTDDGATFRDVTDRVMLLQDRAVEAIEVDPTNPDVAYVGLFGKGIDHANDAGMLFKTINGGGAWVSIGATIRAANGTRLSINAIAVDPLNPRHVYVGTPGGVWFSDDGGGTWQEFSQGLPNVFVMDLELERTSRTLRCALWGRGIWERTIADRPARDRRVFIRSSLQDQGFRPTVEGHDGFATTPSSTALISSPDIKNSAFRPDVGATDVEIDGVEFDEIIQHEEPVEGAATLFVQVHNHGSFPATGVRVTALWAETSCGPPPLDANFWATLAAGAPVAPAPWTIIPGGVIAGDLVVGTPRAIGLAVNWPAAIGNAREIAILVVVTSAEDAVAATETDTAKLVRAESKAAIRLTETRRLADAREIHLAATGRFPFSITGGSAGAAIGLPPAAVARFHRGGAGVVGGGGPGTFNMSGVVAPRTLIVDNGAPTTVTFAAPDIPDPANATAGQIRRSINRQLTLARFPGRAIVGRTDLSIATSSTDEGARPLALESAHLADLVVRQAAVAPADRAALFGLIARLEADRIRPNVDNHFLLRVTNRGSADQTDVRCRLYHLVFPLAAPPPHVVEVVHAPGVAAHAADVVDLVWNPGALAGTFAVVLTTAESAAREPVTLPAAGFADIDAVRAFCRTTNNAAYRVIPVS